MKEEIWNELYLYLIRIEIGVFKNFKECARSPRNGKHFSSYVCVIILMSVFSASRNSASIVRLCLALSILQLWFYLIFAILSTPTISMNLWAAFFT